MKLIQICASQNDLFGLDDEGVVHHYNFSTNSWIALARGRQQSEALSRKDDDNATGSDDAGLPSASGERNAAAARSR